MGKKVRVQLFSANKAVTIDPAATDGARAGVNLYDENGHLVRSLKGLFPSLSRGPKTTDGLLEGRYNLYFKDKRAVAAVAAVLAASETVTLEYDAATGAITAVLANLADSGQGELVGIQRDQYGRVAGTRAVDSDDLTEGAEHLFFTPERARAAAAAAAPTRIAAGATYTVPADTQLLFTLPIDIEGDGVLDVTGDLAEVA